ncbi:MAG: ATPase [Acidobacteria bacterium RIFCSPLOWO2_12_FULL_54_10]|nr:MAG: ATPase [Acidobacteria bacterium RIFCSPLOWO2_12_FULL_54_10]
MQSKPLNHSSLSSWHTLHAEEVMERLNSGVQGLSSAEASLRLDKYGPNELLASRRISPWKLLLDQFKNILIVILIIATVLSGFMGHLVEAIAIAVIVLFAAFLGFVQEFRAERAMEMLQRMAAPITSVIRDGEEAEIPAQELVPGDIILIKAGDKIAADARLFEAINLKLDEASLTGESVPVDKYSERITTAELAIGDRKNMIYSGTSATYGRGRAIVVATGMDTEFGRIAQLLQKVEISRTPLQENLDNTGYALARAALVVVALIAGVGLLHGRPFMEMLLFGIALAVAVVPEALPAVVTISLAIGVQRMVKRHALIRRLPAVETLGSVSIICSDKTGTLTKDEMTVRKIWVAGEILDVTGEGYIPVGQFMRDGAAIKPSGPLLTLLQSAALACDAHLLRRDSGGTWDIKGDPTEGAIVVAAAKAGLHKTELDATYPRVHEIPFTSESKRMTTLHGSPDNLTAYSKGAPEIIIASCSRIMTQQGELPLNEDVRETILEQAQIMASLALRVLAVARKSEATIESAEHEMAFLGLLGMIDPPRPEAKASIRKCEEAGIQVTMITGDHPVTANAIASELGISKSSRVLTGKELEAMPDEELERESETIRVYARVSPAHKLRIVTALQKRGHIIAMTGDGVNDAPALKKADIGIAMGITGTDVAKEAAAMTLTDDNFASIVAAVEEGRGIFDNIRKYLMYLLSSNIGEIGLMAGATLLGMPLPLSAVQILYINLATDGLPALALAVDPPASDLMRFPPRNPRVGIFTRPVIALMLAGGGWSAIVNLALFAWALHSNLPLPEAMTLTFVSLVMIQFFKAYSFRSDRHSILIQPFTNKWLNLSILWEILLLVCIVYLPIFNVPFGTYALTVQEWILAISLAFTVVPVLELVKWLERRGWFGATEQSGSLA